MTSVLAGVWVANLSKSRRHANHQFQCATLTVNVDGDLVSLHHAGVNMAGKEESGTTILQADGVEHEVSPQAPGVVVVARWAGPRILETEAKKEGGLSARIVCGLGRSDDADGDGRRNGCGRRPI